MEEWAAWFREQLLARDLTQEQAARDLEVTLATVGRWARGHGTPSFRQLVHVYRVWGELPSVLTER